MTSEMTNPHQVGDVTQWFEVGRSYARDEVWERLGLPINTRRGGIYVTGYAPLGSAVYIFCNVGVAGRTGHDYPNRWIGKDLVWYGKTGSTAEQSLIAEMISGKRHVHVFWRGNDRAPFTYAGQAAAEDVDETSSPVEIIWSFETDAERPTPLSGPRWRRGPPPASGERSIAIPDGPTSVYVFALRGDPSLILPGASPAGHTIIKIGMSRAPKERLKQLNSGFPPTSAIHWTLLESYEFATGKEAYLVEGRALEALRMRGEWIGGEFGLCPSAHLPLALEPHCASANSRGHSRRQT